MHTVSRRDLFVRRIGELHIVSGRNILSHRGVLLLAVCSWDHLYQRLTDMHFLPGRDLRADGRFVVLPNLLSWDLLCRRSSTLYFVPGRGVFGLRCEHLQPVPRGDLLVLARFGLLHELCCRVRLRERLLDLHFMPPRNICS